MSILETKLRLEAGETRTEAEQGPRWKPEAGAAWSRNWAPISNSAPTSLHTSGQIPTHLCLVPSICEKEPSTLSE